jgi:ketosteroid isomerase-like protein
MHPNRQLLSKLFHCLNQHDHKAMADCYDDKAVFRDIGFTLNGKDQIHAMWDMICSKSPDGKASDIVVTIKELSADDYSGRAITISEYTFREEDRKVRNTIVSHFEFRDGKILSQLDDCNARVWAKQSIGGLKGFLAGFFPSIIRKKAMKKLRDERPKAFENA